MANGIDEYLARLGPTERGALERIRETVHECLPEAEEVITYAMPGFRYKGKYLLAFSAFSDHLSVFPGAEAVATVKAALPAYKVSKGTIQFTIERPLPPTLIAELIEIRRNSIDHSVK